MSQLLLKGYHYLISEKIKDLKKEAELFKALMEERELKEHERDLGDYIYSFGKCDKKLIEYFKLWKQGKITEQEYRTYVKLTKQHFEGTQRIKRKRFGTSTKEDRKREFVQKHGYKVSKNGKIRKAQTKT